MPPRGEYISSQQLLDVCSSTLCLNFTVISHLRQDKLSAHPIGPVVWQELHKLQKQLKIVIESIQQDTWCERTAQQARGAQLQAIVFLNHRYEFFIWTGWMEFFKSLPLEPLNSSNTTFKAVIVNVQLLTALKPQSKGKPSWAVKKMYQGYAACERGWGGCEGSGGTRTGEMQKRI